MSGGGKPKSGLMGNKIVEEYTDEQIKTVEKKISMTEHNLQQLKLESDKLEMEVAQI